MSLSLSRSATARPRPGLISHKALVLSALALLLVSTMRPARAQYPGETGSWQALPCDSGGNLTGEALPVTLKGTENITPTNTYPTSLPTGLDPINYGWLLGASNPLDNSPSDAVPAQELVHQGYYNQPNQYDYGIGDDNYVGVIYARNYVMSGNSYIGNYTVYPAPDNTLTAPVTVGPWSGSVTRTADGTLWGYLKWAYVGSYSHQPIPVPSGGPPMPDHMDVLMFTGIYAGTEVDYPASTHLGA